jgi:predicted transcriptional regulator
MIIPFLRERPANILLILRDTTKSWYISSVSRETGLTYLHTLNTLSQYYNLGIIDYKKEGRKKAVILTEKGKNIASVLSQLVTALKE